MLNIVTIVGKEAEKVFRNLRNKYGREKRKWKAANKSGAGAKDVNIPKILKLLNWLEPYFVERDTSTNFEPTQSVELDERDEEEEINDDLNNRSVCSEDSFMSAIVTKPNEASQQKNNVKKISSATPNAPRKSVVTGRPAFKKHKKEETDMDDELMSTLKARLEAKKDENQLYADLLAAKLRKLTKLNKLRADTSFKTKKLHNKINQFMILIKLSSRV